MHKNIKELTIVELFEDLEYGEESLAETEGQHQAETAHYGDSWPGAQRQIAAQRDECRKTREEIARREEREA